ncbi:MAG: DUF5777 family beta-barrel protein [Bacteroidota bacterium]
MKKHLLLIATLFISFCTDAQEDDLLSLLDDDSSDEINYTFGTFKGTRVINTQSVDIQAKKELLFIITHRFGYLNTGFDSFYGLDEANVRIGFEYGINDIWAVGIGRSGAPIDVYDGYSKLKLLRQSTGAKNMPVSVVWNANVAVQTSDFIGAEDVDLSFADRLFFTHQLLIARKFNKRFSFQLAPTYTHNNTLEFEAESNDTFSLGLSTRVQITKRMAVLADYYRIFDENFREMFEEPLAIGVEFETGGHVFQLVFTNALGMTERVFLSRELGSWADGDVSFGFNIQRTFPFGGRGKNIK